MTRIIGGVAGSLKLAAPAKSTRPTSDRIRESIFNRLESRDLLQDSVVLDLYAGTGALGLEALSRGARFLAMAEKNRQAAAVVTKNAEAVSHAITKTSHGVEWELFATDAKHFLLTWGQKVTSEAKPKFDLVFIDPPYEISNDEVVQNLEDLEASLEAEAVVVVERSSRMSEPNWPNTFELELRKNYGDTAVFWLIKN